MDLKKMVETLGENAKAAARKSSLLDTAVKNSALSIIEKNLKKSQPKILAANQKDLENGKKAGLSDALLDRLALNPERIDGIIESVRQIRALPDPVGAIENLHYRPSGIRVGRMRTPLGVIGMIYESRPNVTVDAAALCLKAGNAVILRGGSEALFSNLALHQCIVDGLKTAGINPHFVQFVDRTERDIIQYLIENENYLDAVIPRGGQGLIETIAKHACVPVIKHLHGVCHTYLDEDAEVERAIKIAVNGKTHRYGVCNATETLLVHQNLADQVMPELVKIFTEKGVEIRGCEKTRGYGKNILKASAEDWKTEYLAPILAVRIVENLDAAIDHIDRYGSKHTDAIVTENLAAAQKFLRTVDSASVIVNASTRFADGFEYGLGGEIGISTDKIHVRGPVGLEGLTSQKYIVIGNGNIRL